MNLIEDKERIASFDVDPQYSFTPVCPDDLPVPHGDEIAEALNEQARYAKYRLGSKEAHPVHAIWRADEKKPILTKIAGENVDVHWPLHCVPGTKGFETLKGLPHPSQYDFYVWKGIEPDMHPYGSCYHDFNKKLSTGVIEFLRSKNVKLVIVGGLIIEYCVKETVLELLAAKFHVVVNLKACKYLDEKIAKETLDLMVAHGAIVVHSLDELRSQNKKEPTPL